MKLYTRLIDSGAFVFWESDEGNTSYTLKIRILNGNDKIELVNLDIQQGQNYYSFDRVGSGDYEIELNGYRGEHLYQTETKKIKIISSVQKNEEQTDRIIACLTNIFNKLSSVKDDTVYIESAMSDLNSAMFDLNNLLNDPEHLARLKHSVEDQYRDLYHY